MQFAEGLSDAQAADAVRGRIDWKYALALELTDAGFDSSVLCEFRKRLITGNAELALFETMLTLFRQYGLLKAKGRQRSDSTHVLAAVHVLNRLECVGETLRAALNSVAAEQPEWLATWLPSAWLDRYARRFEEYRLPPEKPARYKLAEQIGADGRSLLQAVFGASAPAELRMLEAVHVLCRVWLQQFVAVALDEPMRWRIAEELPPAPLLYSSPYDPDARYGKKRTTIWTGYKVHLTETCDDDTPHLVTDVTTTPATTTDFAVLPAIQEHLATRKLVPGEHIVDSGYVSSEHLVSSGTNHDIELIGPAPVDHSWQARADKGFAAALFAIDWEKKQATCPEGKTSAQWLRRKREGDPVTIQIKFAKAECAACPVRADCTNSANQPRMLLVRDQEQYEALQAARERQQSELFHQQYARRAGIEGTISQGVQMGDLRRSRYRGEAKTRLLHVLIATALNFMRVAAWLAEIPRARTRQSAFARLTGLVASRELAAC